MIQLNIPVKTKDDEVYHQEFNAVVAKINELVNFANGDEPPVVTLISIAITSTGSINEGGTLAFTSITSYSDGSTQNVTSQTIFSSTEGTFTDNILSIVSNNTPNDNRTATVTGTYQSQTATQVINIVNVDPGKLNQTISFTQPIGKTIISSDFNAGATASSLLPVSYNSSNPNVATIDSSGLISITGVGAAIITASQAGNVTYNPAIPVTRNLIIDYAVDQNLVDTKLLLYSDSIGGGASASGAEFQWKTIVGTNLGLTIDTTAKQQGGRTLQQALEVSASNSVEKSIETLGSFGFPRYTGDAKYVFITVGVNDVNVSNNVTNPPSVFGAKYREIVNRFLNVGKYPKSKIIICNITPVNPANYPDSPARLVDFNAQINSMVTDMALTMVDINTAFVNGGGNTLLADGLHPNNAGHALYADTVLQKLGVILLPPNVSAGADQTIVLPTANVVLSGTASGNNGATIDIISWTQVSGASVTITNPTQLSTNIVGFVTEGNAIFRLSVTDSNGLTSHDDVLVVINGSSGNPLSEYFAKGVTEGAQQTAATSLYNTLQSQGVWDHIIALHLPLGVNSSVQKYNVKLPNDTTHELTFVNDDPDSHTSQGFLPANTVGAERYATRKALNSLEVSNSSGLCLIADNRTPEGTSNAFLMGTTGTGNLGSFYLQRRATGAAVKGLAFNTAPISQNSAEVSNAGIVGVNYEVATGTIYLKTDSGLTKSQAQVAPTNIAGTNIINIGAGRTSAGAVSAASTCIVGSCLISRGLTEAQFDATIAALKTFRDSLSI